MADIQEIQEYLWKDPIFHNYSLTKTDKTKANYNVHTARPYTAEVTRVTFSLVSGWSLFSLPTSVLQFVCLMWVRHNLYLVKSRQDSDFIYMEKC